jgi:F-type H+/Na+-transporting ATPase subunit alpha
MQILEELKNSLVDKEFSQYQQGQVSKVSDSVIEITGLKSCQYLEVLEVINNGLNSSAIVLELNEQVVKAVLLDESLVSAGAAVISTNKLLKLKIDPSKRGVIYDALGNIQLDLLNQNATDTIELFIEDSAPELMDREPVSRPLQTGILAIDALANVGMGQRQLIIGDRQTGKTSLAIDSIINQKGKKVTCIYCAVGQKRSDIIKTVTNLKKNSALDYTVIFNSSADSSVALQYLTPFAAVTLGQYLMNNGDDVLVIYDDLSKHAVAWRQLSLLLKRPVGREAYPGDVFFLHSRLLERGGQLVDEVGGGSLTALPIVETLANDVTGYIPTNVISITDGQIYLEPSLFNAGIRPAISPGLSVSRVGSAAQSKSIKKTAGKIKLELSQYRELASFSQIGSGLDEATRKTLEHGNVLTRCLIQKNNNPLEAIQMIARLRLCNTSFFDKKKNQDIDKYLLLLDETILSNMDENLGLINNGKWDDQLESHLEAIISKFTLENK